MSGMKWPNRGGSGFGMGGAAGAWPPVHRTEPIIYEELALLELSKRSGVPPDIKRIRRLAEELRQADRAQEPAKSVIDGKDFVLNSTQVVFENTRDGSHLVYDWAEQEPESGELTFVQASSSQLVRLPLSGALRSLRPDHSHPRFRDAERAFRRWAIL